MWYIYTSVHAITRTHYCAGHGSCLCNGACSCNDGFIGFTCNCPTSSSSCINPDGNQLCSNHGDCRCGICVCQNYTLRSGTYCQLCPVSIAVGLIGDFPFYYMKALLLILNPLLDHLLYFNYVNNFIPRQLPTIPSVCVCVCACVRACVRACVCVCVCACLCEHGGFPRHWCQCTSLFTEYYTLPLRHTIPLTLNNVMLVLSSSHALRTVCVHQMMSLL